MMRAVDSVFNIAPEQLRSTAPRTDERDADDWADYAYLCDLLASGRDAPSLHKLQSVASSRTIVTKAGAVEMMFFASTLALLMVCVSS